jgi:hypothetical protein
MTEAASGALSPLEIRSFRTVFDLERRIYRIDRLRLHPGGIPLRGVVYFAALALAAVIASGLPVVGWVLSAAPWYVRDVAVPGASSAVLAMVRVEGRPFHLAARALLRHAVGARHLSHLRPAQAPGTLWWPQDLLILPDGSDSRHRQMAFRGPGAVLLRTAHECHETSGSVLSRLLRRPHLTVSEVPGAPRPRRAQVIELGPGTILRVRPPKRS